MAGANDSRSARPKLLLLALALTALAALIPASAFAAKTHPYTGTSFGPDGAAGSAAFINVQSIAVEQASGDVYVYDAGEGGKLYKFDSAGQPLDFATLGANVIESVGASGNGENQIAVAPAGSPGGTPGDIYVANYQAAAVSVYGAGGAKLGEFGEEHSCGVATDPAGHVFVGVYPETVQEYVPSANPPTNADKAGSSLAEAELPQICNVAADGLANVYATNYNGAKIAKLEGLGDASPTTIEPGAPTLAIDPASEDLYADRGGEVAQYDSAGQLLSAFGAGQLSGGSRGVAVNATSGEAYAASGDGKVAVFGPLVVLADVSTEAATLSGTTVTLRGAVNPDGVEVSECKFEYGPTSAYGNTAPCEGALPIDSEAHPVSATLSGLATSATYHFRLVATNANGPSQSPDRSFAIYPPAPPIGPCANDPFRSGAGAALPDCRAYEQATPTDKHGASVAGTVNVVQASASGNRITFADAAGLPSSGGSSTPPVYLASRGAGGWTSDSLLPLTEPGRRAKLMGWDSEIATAASAVASANPGVALRDSASGAFQLVATPGGIGESISFLAAFAADPAHLIFESNFYVLAPGAVEGKVNLYELDHGALSAVGRIPTGGADSCDDSTGPACVPAPEGSFAGSYDTFFGGGTAQGGASISYYTQNTISADGSKVFFTAAGTGQLYVREDGTRTTRISAPYPSSLAPDPNGPKPAAFLGATPDGSQVFFASCEKLTADSTAVSTVAESCIEEEQGQDLYAYDTDSGELSDLTIDANPGDPRGAAVVGLLGASADGSYVYFAANGVLAPGAAPGACRISSLSASGSCNLYLAHAGAIGFVAPLNARTADRENWLPLFESQQREVREARVAEDGTLLFGSTQNLSGYDNALADAGANCRAEAQNRCRELYRYAPGAGELDCISCNPTGGSPSGSATLESRRTAFNAAPQTALLTRNLSADGTRAFFDSPDQLVAADTNGVVDPYEWEAVGTDSCEVAQVSGGCLYLLSSGTSPDPSYLGDVSASGEDAFIFTAEALVPSDKDQLVDVYDARVGGGLASQHPPPAAPPCLGSACRGPFTSAPSESSAGSAGFSGPGNRHCERNKKKCNRHKRHKKQGSKKHRGHHGGRGGSK